MSLLSFFFRFSNKIPSSVSTGGLSSVFFFSSHFHRSTRSVMYVCMGLQRKGKDTKWDMTSEAGGVFFLSQGAFSQGILSEAFSGVLGTTWMTKLISRRHGAFPYLYFSLLMISDGKGRRMAFDTVSGARWILLRLCYGLVGTSHIQIHFSLFTI